MPPADSGDRRQHPVVSLPPGVRICRAHLESEESGMLFEIERDGHRVAFDLPETEALAVALAILGISIEIRDALGPRWRPRLIEGGQE
jgi:hypothetical protein